MVGLEKRYLATEDVTAKNNGEKVNGKEKAKERFPVVDDTEDEECIRELECPAKMFGGYFHVRRDYPSPCFSSLSSTQYPSSRYTPLR